MKLTKRAIAAIVPDSTRDKCIWDDEVRGFGCGSNQLACVHSLSNTEIQAASVGASHWERLAS